MTKKEFDELTRGKSEYELTRILNRYTNDLIKLNSKQVDRIIKLKNKLSEKKRNIWLY